MLYGCWTRALKSGIYSRLLSYFPPELSMYWSNLKGKLCCPEGMVWWSPFLEPLLSRTELRAFSIKRDFFTVTDIWKEYLVENQTWADLFMSLAVSSCLPASMAGKFAIQLMVTANRGIVSEMALWRLGVHGPFYLYFQDVVVLITIFMHGKGNDK